MRVTFRAWTGAAAPHLPFAQRLVRTLCGPHSTQMTKCFALRWDFVRPLCLLVIVILLYEGIGDFLAAIQW